MEPKTLSAQHVSPGLHDVVISLIVAHANPVGRRALDLGTGTGQLAERLASLGMQVIAADIRPEHYTSASPFVQLDLNEPHFARKVTTGPFDLITAVEVIEHLEAPIGFLRNVRRLLHPDGLAVVTTPNVENLPARLRFLFSGKLRAMDHRANPEHISPIFADLMVRQYLPRAQLRVVAVHLYPPTGYLLTRPKFSGPLALLARLLGGRALLGDSRIFFVKPA